MNRLTAESLWERASIAPGQSRGDGRVMQGACWSDQNGSRIGSGDLGHEDFVALTRVLKETEFFFALDSETGHLGRGIESISYVTEHARFMVGRFQLYYLWPHPRLSTVVKGVEFQIISRERARMILAESKFMNV